MSETLTATPLHAAYCAVRPRMVAFAAGKCRMLDCGGGVIDDLVVYYLAEDRFRIVVNAGTADKDSARSTPQLLWGNDDNA